MRKLSGITLTCVLLLLLVVITHVSDAIELKCHKCRDVPLDDPCRDVETCDETASTSVCVIEIATVEKNENATVQKGCEYFNLFAEDADLKATNRENTCATPHELSTINTRRVTQYSHYCVCTKNLCNKNDRAVAGAISIFSITTAQCINMVAVLLLIFSN